jgi:hypothetical protein
MQKISLLFLIAILTSNNSNAQRFTRINTGSVVSDGGASQGVSWIDYDNDGYLDLFITNMMYPGGHVNFLYRNLGDGTFNKITSGQVVTDSYASRSCTWGDFDNDGNPDLFVTNLGSHSNCFYKNNGDGAFIKETGSIITQENPTSTSASWGDYNNDGLLDLVVANYGKNFLFQNDGADFIKIIEGPIATDETTSYLTLWGDYNNDGNPDLFVANSSDIGPLPNNLYKNNRDGSFNSIQEDPVVTDNTEMGSGASWGDYNNDGHLDLFVANISYQTAGNNFLYHNNGDGSFTRITTGNIVNDGGYSFGSAWGDFDNDGDLDLAVANFNVGAGGVNFLYSNNGDGTFTRLTGEEITTDDFSSVGLAWGDYDRDGDLDLMVANSRNDNENNALYRNNGNSNSWINIKLIGTQSNKSALGTKLRMKAVIDGQSIWQLREVSGLTGYCSQNSLNVHFGFGDALIIDSLKIEWPSEIVQVFENVEVNHFISIEEGNVLGIIDNGHINQSPHNFHLFQNYPNPFNPATTIKYSLSTEGFVTLKIYGVLGNEIATLVNEEKLTGTYEINFDATGLPSGFYFYQLKADLYSSTKKMLIIR